MKFLNDVVKTYSSKANPGTMKLDRMVGEVKRSTENPIAFVRDAKFE